MKDVPNINMKNKSREYYYVLGLAFLFAMAQLHHILLFFSTTLAANIDAAIGITTGHPHWRIYQNRVLGPYLLKGLAGFFPGDYVGSYLFLLAISLFLAGYQAWRIGNKIGGGLTGWFALVSMHLLFAFLFSETWLYIWDFIGLNIFLAFVEFVIYERPWYWFIALFAIAILNRDSGQFIALWMVLEPVCRRLVRNPMPRRQAITMAMSGILCVIAGIIIINFLRTSLLVEEVGFNLIGRTPPSYGPNFFWNLPDNLYLLQHLEKFSLKSILSASLAITIFLAVITFSIVLIRKDLSRYLALSIIFIISAVSIPLFGYIVETRVFIELIPLLILGSCLLFGRGEFSAQARIFPVSAGKQNNDMHKLR
jgi:hypothetical protein